MQIQIDNLGKVAVTVEKDFWDITKDYDRLTIVETPNNTYATYISRKPVPAGTVLTDRDYWIPFSSLKEEIVLDYNTFIELWTQNLIDTNRNLNDRIDREVSTLNGRIDNEVNTLNGRITSEVSAINGREDYLQQQISSNDADIAEIKDTHSKDVHDLYDAISSLVVGGVALKQEFSTDDQSEVYGISQKTLTEAIGYVHTDDEENFIPLQDQIDNIVSGKAVVSLIAYTNTIPATTITSIFIGEPTELKLTANSDVATASKDGVPGIQIYREGTPIEGGSAASGRTHEVVISETPDHFGTVSYSANFLISGLQRTANRLLNCVYPLYYGGADIYTDLVNNNNRASARTSVNGTYNITLSAETYIFFIVPVSLGPINSAKMGGFDFSLEAPVDVNIDEVPYRIYRTPQKQEVGSYSIVLS